MVDVLPRRAPYAPVARPATVGGHARTLYLATVSAFILSTLFDPADLLLGFKLPLYFLCWATGLLVCFAQRSKLRLPLWLASYTLLMVAIPLVSIAVYLIVDGREPFEGFQLFKAYLFISMAILLYATRTDLLPLLGGALTALSLAVLAVGTVVLLQPDLFLPLYAFGNRYGMFSLDNRDYGGGLVMFQMYFVTSPMLAVSAAYYFEQAVARPARRRRYVILTLLNLGGLAFAGSRNNLLAAVLLPLLLLFLHTRRKVVTGTALAVAGSIGLALVSDTLAILLDPLEQSNRTKLTTLNDYGTVLARPLTLLLGRGLGAYEHWTGRGYQFQTEITYLEIVRNFGVVLGGLMILLLLYPIAYAFVIRRSFPQRSVMVGYLVYLLMCVSNPYLFSSMGMLILSILTANMALFQMGRLEPPGGWGTPAQPASRAVHA